ncbi:hypothetical protein B0H14DRAFT_2628482 [Mycena olivaceomarginata]|nr:hypothetical protein B0H14DRAFT_2628482 [Mycena olivaceomarginata]
MTSLNLSPNWYPMMPRHSLKDYLRLESARQRLTSTNEQPWLPVCTRLDFKVSEFAQENMLNRAATNKLLSLIRRCGANLEEFTIRNWQDMNKQWDAASKKCTDFEAYKVEVPYKNMLVPFKMHANPLWNWTLDLIQDPCVAKCFIWDAVKMYRHNGKSFVRFWNEPWTADAFWELQKAHPIIVRVLNTITGIGNNSEWGGGQVVGELPIIDDNTAESGKTSYGMDHMWRWREKVAVPLHSNTLRDYEEANLATINLPNLISSSMLFLGLNHFKTVTNISFNDGSKHEDIAKMMVFAAHNILTAETDKIGLLLLVCIRSYLEINMYAGLELHTADTIADGWRQLQKFDQSLKKYRHTCKGTDFADKNWNFPKAHLHQHLFDDIERKGVTRNYNTKISEPLHRPLQNAYHNQTNFKNVQPQLGDLNQFLDDDENPENLPPADLEVVGNIIVGSKLPATSFLALEAEMKKDATFTKFRIRFVEFLNMFLPAYGYPLPHGKRVALVAGEEIMPYQFLKVFFKSLENWLDNVDFLRCNPFSMVWHGMMQPW